jgi:single-stranded-DNA-specific exonuclease
MDLRGENRVLTSFGLKTLSECDLVGVEALIESAGLSGRGLDSYHIGFRLGPMLNAAGRMGHARLAVELLTCQSQVRAMQIAEYLKGQNSQRQQLERKIFKQACEMINKAGLNHPDIKTIVLTGDGWHKGVIGIVASRIVDKYYRPTIILNTSEPIARGSGRSIAGFDILAAIRSCSEYLVNFGGHKMAAGVSIEREKIEQFAAAFEDYAGVHLNADDVIDKLHIDGEAELSKLRKEAVAELQMLEPFGEGNPKPIFATKGVRLVSAPRRVGAKGNHLQLAVSDNTASVRCIGFGMGRLEKKLLEKDFFNVAYQPAIDDYNGGDSVQLVLSDIQFE